MLTDFIPSTDAGLLAWASNFSALITATPVEYGLTAGIASNYSGLCDAYSSALTNATAPATRGPASVLAKNEARVALVANSRQIARMVQGNIGVSNEQRQALGLTVRKTHPTPVPAPTVRPAVDLVDVSVRTVSINIHDSASSTKRGKPAGTIGAKVYYFVGASYPSDPSLWNYDGDCTKAKHEITFADSVPAGAQVWICAAWYARRNGDTGPASVPISTNVQGGGSSQEQDLKIAA